MMDVALSYNTIMCSVKVNAPTTIDIDYVRFRRTTLSSPWYIDYHYNAPSGTTLSNHVVTTITNINIGRRETTAVPYITFYDAPIAQEISPLMEVQKVVDLTTSIGD